MVYLRNLLSRIARRRQAGSSLTVFLHYQMVLPRLKFRLNGQRHADKMRIDYRHIHTEMLIDQVNCIFVLNNMPSICNLLPG